MTARICNILFPVDLSARSVLATQHVKSWADRFHATLHTFHVVDIDALGLARDPLHQHLYEDLFDVVSKRTADLKYFSDQYSGGTVATHTVLSGGTQSGTLWSLPNHAVFQPCMRRISPI